MHTMQMQEAVLALGIGLVPVGPSTLPGCSPSWPKFKEVPWLGGYTPPRRVGAAGQAVYVMYVRM